MADEDGRRPLLTTDDGRPTTSTIRNWFYRWTQPCRIGEACPGDREPESCEATNHDQAGTCLFNVSSHPVR